MGRGWAPTLASGCGIHSGIRSWGSVTTAGHAATQRASVQGSERKLQWEAPVGSSSGLGSLMQFPAIAHRTFPSMQPGDAATLAGASILVALTIERRAVIAVLAKVLPSIFGSCQALDICHLCGTL